MKKTISILIICFSLHYGCTQTGKDQNLNMVKDFFDAIVLNDKYTQEEIVDYIAIDTTESQILDLLKIQIDNLKANCEQDDTDCKILHHSDLIEHNLSSKLVYKDYSKVYYLIAHNKIVAPLIVEDDKLISISFGFYKTMSRKNAYPMLLRGHL